MAWKLGRTHPSMRDLACVIAGGLAWSLVSPCAIAAPASIEPAQKAVMEWSRIRSETVRMETQWEWERETLRTTEIALQDRVRALEEKQAVLNAKSSGERKSLDELAAKNAATDAALKNTAERMQEIAAELTRLRPSLPPRLSQGLELAFRSANSPTASVGERAQHVLTILTRCGQFNRVITPGEEVLRLPGESEEKLVEVIYWGLSHAYALDRAKGIAYLGGPTEKGWTWVAKPEAAAAVSQLLAMARDKADPAFVEVPARVMHASSKPIAAP